MTGLQLLGTAMAAVDAERRGRRPRTARLDLRPLVDGRDSLVVGPGSFRRMLASPGRATQIGELTCPTYAVSGAEPHPAGVLCVAGRPGEVPRLVRTGLREAVARQLPLRVVHAWRPPDAHRYAQNIRSDRSGRAMDLEDLRGAVLGVPGANEADLTVETHYRGPAELVDEGVGKGELVLVGEAGLVPRPPATSTPAARPAWVVAVVPSLR
jgi:hypothetical protein